MKLSVLNFSCPNSIYNINEYNNILKIQIGSNSIITYNFPYGNHKFNTFKNAISSNIILNSLIVSLNPINNIISFSHASNDFIIYSDSTILNIIGGVTKTTYNSSSFILLMPYQCNFNGVNNINIYFSNLRTKNYESFNKCTSSLIQSIYINPYEAQIKYSKTNDYSILINDSTIDYIEVQILDDLKQYINFNNINWNMTILVELIKDIPRFIENDFHSIILNDYQNN